MKTLMTLLALTFIGCGGSGSGLPENCKGNALQGVWENDGTNDLLEMQTDCHATSSYCESEFLYDKNFSDDTSTAIVVSKTNGKAGCPSVGAHGCQAVVVNNYLHFDCGSGEIVYKRIAQ